MENLDQAIQQTIKFYTDNGISIPNSVTEYMDKYPKGLSRQVLKTRYNLTCAEFIKLINSSYTKPLSAKERALVEAQRLDYTIISDLDILKSNRDKLDLRCNICESIHTTTIISLSGSKLGCPSCKSGNLPWYKREQELKDILDQDFDAELCSNIPSNQIGYITIKHRVCGTEYVSQLVGVVSPTTKLRATCPNCRTTDRRVVYNNITFGSQFELDCYHILKHLNPEIHVNYSDYLPTDRRWVCDFKVKNMWIEVSNFKQDFKGYFANIQEKENLVESNGDIFLFVRSLNELTELVSMM